MATRVGARLFKIKVLESRCARLAAVATQLRVSDLMLMSDERSGCPMAPDLVLLLFFWRAAIQMFASFLSQHLGGGGRDGGGGVSTKF